MNIQMQAGGILILLLLLFFYKRRKTLNLYSGKLFMLTLYISLACLILDILSVLMIVNSASLPAWLVKIECKTYLVSLVAHGFMALIYANADIRGLAKPDRYTYTITGVTLGSEVLIYALPIEWYCDGTGVVYTYGLSCYAAYGAAAAICVVTVAKLVIHRKTINKRRRGAILLWLIIWVCCALTQLIFPNVLLVGFAGALGVVILFYELENPDIYIDRGTGFFNSLALVEFVKQSYRLKADVCGILVSLENVRSGSLPSGKTDAVIAEVSRFIGKLPGVTVFKTDDREFSISVKNQEEQQRVFKMIRERFKKPWLSGDGVYDAPVYIQPYYLIIPSGKIAGSADEMMEFLRYFRLRCLDASESGTMFLDEKTVAEKHRRDEILDVIMRAIKDDRVEVFFQPIYSVSEKKFVSAEALARIRAEDGRIIPPGEFIPIAEEMGLISQIGEIIFKKTCRFISERSPEKLGVGYIEVNLSVVQCEDEKLAQKYIDIMEGYKLPPGCINLEITESAAVGSKSILISNMQRLMRRGVSFSLDDFGSGQSNLNYILDLPVEIVKFDYYMTQSYFQNVKASFVIEAVLGMFHDLRLKIVSEGVETAEQFEAISQLGADYIQGFYFTKPLPPDEFLEFVKNYRHDGQTADEA